MKIAVRMNHFKSSNRNVENRFSALRNGVGKKIQAFRTSTHELNRVNCV